MFKVGICCSTLVGRQQWQFQWHRYSDVQQATMAVPMAQVLGRSPVAAGGWKAQGPSKGPTYWRILERWGVLQQSATLGTAKRIRLSTDSRISRLRPQVAAQIVHNTLQFFWLICHPTNPNKNHGKDIHCASAVLGISYNRDGHGRRRGVSNGRQRLDSFNRNC